MKKKININVVLGTFSVENDDVFRNGFNNLLSDYSAKTYDELPESKREEFW